MQSYDPILNRKRRNYSYITWFRRFYWSILGVFWVLVPHRVYFVRNYILRFAGAKIGCGVRIGRNVRVTFPWNLYIGDNVGIGDYVTLYALGKIIIHDGATVSQYSHICAASHDIKKRDRPLIFGEVVLGKNSWVAANCFVGYKLCIGSGAIVGAGSVVRKSVPENAVVHGNPARDIVT